MYCWYVRLFGVELSTYEIERKYIINKNSFIISAKRPPVEETASFLQSLIASHGPNYLVNTSFGFTDVLCNKLSNKINLHQQHIFLIYRKNCLVVKHVMHWVHWVVSNASQ